VTPGRRPVLMAFASALALVLVGPTVIVTIMSFSAGRLLSFPPRGLSLRWYGNFLGDDTWVRAIVNSIQVGIGAALVATLVGALMAFGIVRGRYPGRAAVNALVLGPMLVPSVVLSIGLYFFFVRLKLVGSLLGLVVAHACLGLPYVVLVVSSGLRTLDPSLERAASSLGAGPVRTFVRVTLPLILPSVLAGALFAFITSWDDVIIAFFLSSPVTRTLPVVMWGATQDTTDPTLAAVATFLSVVTTAAFLLFLLVRRRTPLS
jgi:ABC-type spermidine/putrescine transport system permease subunit II